MKKPKSLEIVASVIAIITLGAILIAISPWKKTDYVDIDFPPINSSDVGYNSMPQDSFGYEDTSTPSSSSSVSSVSQSSVS